MTEPQKALREAVDPELEDIYQLFQTSFDTDKRLFRAELAVNYAYCDSLFDAGILTRLESENIKNGNLHV